MARLPRLAAAVVGALSLASAADAHITKIEIVAKESPTFGGYSFPAVGQYEKIVGKAFGELDPNAPGNTVIVDLELAPRNARGRVEYSFDFYILKPIDLRRGAHKVMYEPPNARASYRLRYAAATTDRHTNRYMGTLTHRVHLDDAPEVVPVTGWTFNEAGTAISLLPAGRCRCDDACASPPSVLRRLIRARERRGERLESCRRRVLRPASLSRLHAAIVHRARHLCVEPCHVRRNPHLHE